MYFLLFAWHTCTELSVLGQLGPSHQWVGKIVSTAGKGETLEVNWIHNVFEKIGW